MLKLEPGLMAQLKRKRVQIERHDPNTVLLKQVPPKRPFFNKTHTDLLIQRAQTGMPYLACVDQDLAYRGLDPELAKAFAGGVQKEGWRVLLVDSAEGTNFEAVATRGLAALGFPNQEPVLSLPPTTATTDKGLLDSLGTDLSREAREGKTEPTTGRRIETENTISCLLRWGQNHTPVVVGESGTGKSNMLYAVARTLLKIRPGLKMVRVDAAELVSGCLFDAEKSKLVMALFREALDSKTVLAVENLQCAVLELGHGPLLLSRVLDQGARMVATTLPDYISRLHAPPLARRLRPVLLEEPLPGETVAILETLRPRLISHHRVKIDASVLMPCVKAAQRLPGHYPAKAIALLDDVAANASMLGSRFVCEDDLDPGVQRAMNEAGR